MIPNVVYQTDGGGGSPSTETEKPVAGDGELLKLVKQLADDNKKLKAEIGGLYSRQDKDRNVLGELMGEFKKQKSRGLEDAEAEEEAYASINRRSLESRLERFLESQEKPKDKPSNDGAVNTADIVSRLGMPDVPEVAAFKSRQFSNLQEALEEAVKLSLGLSGKPIPTEAQRLAAESGNIVPKKDDVESLTKEYQEKMVANRGNARVLKDIKAAYRQKGVPVDHVAFRIVD